MFEAAVFVDREFFRGLRKAESWTKDTFQTTMSEHLDLVRCVRASYHMAGKKFAYLQKLPWLIVRIFVPCVKKILSANGLPAHRMSITGT